ncbi:unnamed protein product, partial [Prorocentrum cordatum]
MRRLANRSQIMKATPGRAYLMDPEAGWWQHSSTLLIRYTALATNDKDTRTQGQLRRTTGSMVDPTEANEWKLQVALDFCDEGDLHRICATTDRWTNIAMARAAGRSRKRYLDWAKRAWKEPPCTLHRIAAGPSPSKFEAKVKVVTVGSPCTVMNNAAGVWRQIWTTSACDEKQIIQSDLEHVYAAASVADPEKARGGDDIGPLDIQRLPPRGIEKLAAVYNFVESSGLWTGGVPGQVAKDFAAVGAVVRNGIVEAEPRVSSKTTAIASSPAVALDAHATLEREGCPIKVASASVDVGVDAVGARRRAAAKATKRALKAKRRLVFAKTIGYGGKRWRKVVGPISAVQAILAGAGRGCPTPYEWSRQPHGCEQAEQTRLLPHKDCGDKGQRRDETGPSQLALEFCQTIETGYWNDAAEHLDGEGLQRGGAHACAITMEMISFIRKGSGSVAVEWLPSHSEGAKNAPNDTVRFARALGDACADAWTGAAAQRARKATLLGAAPPTDLRDAQRALIRRRARRALADAPAVDPWVAERPSQATGARLTVLQRALQSSSHSSELCASKYRCSTCRLTAGKRAARQACATLCQPAAPLPVASEQVVPVEGAAAVFGRPLRDSHKLHFMQKFCLHVCRECGKTATEDPRHLAAPCTGVTRKGKENLADIDKGLFTRARAGRDGLTPYVRAAAHGMAVDEAVAAAALAAPAASATQDVVVSSDLKEYTTSVMQAIQEDVARSVAEDEAAVVASNGRQGKALNQFLGVFGSDGNTVSGVNMGVGDTAGRPRRRKKGLSQVPLGKLRMFRKAQKALGTHSRKIFIADPQCGATYGADAHGTSDTELKETGYLFDGISCQLCDQGDSIHDRPSSPPLGQDNHRQSIKAERSALCRIVALGASVVSTPRGLSMISLTAAKHAGVEQDAQRSGRPAFGFEYVTVTLLQEASKLLVATLCFRWELLAEARSSCGHLDELQVSPPRRNVFRLRHFLRFGVPGLLYCLDNNFQYVILGFLQPAELAVLWNFKILATVVLLRVFLHRKYTWDQWAAMLALALGCALTQERPA